jgi:nucleoid DNA-binding protein
MNKLELENIIGNKLRVSGKEQRIAMNVFIQCVSEYIGCDETIRIPDIGIFQLRKTGKNLQTNSLKNSSRESFQLLYVPITYNKEISDVLAFSVSPQQKKKSGSIEEAFSISVGKPLIPLTGTGRDEHLIQSSFIMLQKNYSEKVLRLLEDAIHLKNFKLDFDLSTLQEDIIQSSMQEEEEGYAEDVDLEMPAIPWDFGIASETVIPKEKIEKEKIDSEEKKSRTHSTNEDINPESPEEISLVQPDELQEDYESDEELINDKELISGGEDELSGEMKKEDLAEDSVGMNESMEANIESKSIKENVNNSDGEENKKEKKSYRWLWLVIFLIIIAAGLYYYIFIYKSSKGNNIINQDSQLKYKTPALVKGYSSKKDFFTSPAYIVCADTPEFYRLEI